MSELISEDYERRALELFDKFKKSPEKVFQILSMEYYLDTMVMINIYGLKELLNEASEGLEDIIKYGSFIYNGGYYHQGKMALELSDEALMKEASIIVSLSLPTAKTVQKKVIESFLMNNKDLLKLSAVKRHLGN